MQLTVQVAKPVEAVYITHAMGTGKRRIIPITGGQSVAGEVLAGGADCQLLRSGVNGVYEVL